MLSNRLVQNLFSLRLLAAVAAAPLLAAKHRVALVARRGEVVHFNAVGRQHVETDEAMTLDTIFRLYSQSKPVTGVAVMILYEEGRFLLADPVAKYLPEFSEMRVYVGEKDGTIETEPAAPITIQHLLTHTSGLTYDFFGSPVANLYAEAGATGSAPTSPHGSLEDDIIALFMTGAVTAGVFLPPMTLKQFALATEDGDLLPPTSTRFLPEAPVGAGVVRARCGAGGGMRPTLSVRRGRAA